MHSHTPKKSLELISFIKWKKTQISTCSISRQSGVPLMMTVRLIIVKSVNMHTTGKISAESLMYLNTQALKASAPGGASAKKSSYIQMVVNMNIDASTLTGGKKSFTTRVTTEQKNVSPRESVNAFIARIITMNLRDGHHPMN